MNTKDVKEEISKGLRAYKAFEKAQEVLTYLEGLEQLIKETEQRAESIKAAEEKAINSKKEAEDRLTVSLVAVAKANSDAENIVKEAKENAKKIASEAMAEGGAIVEKAKQDAAKILSGVSDAAKELSEMQVLLEEKYAELATIKEAMAKHKAMFEKYIG